MPLHNRIEVEVMRALRANKGWAGPGTIAEAIDLPIYVVRATLVNLRRQFLCQRGNTVHGHWGEWVITEHGLLELARSEQLRLVG